MGECTMQRKRWLLGILALLAVLIAGCSSSAAGSSERAGGGPAAASAVATSVQNDIELKATFVNATQAVPSGELMFSFALDNHAIDLDGLDLASKATLIPTPGEPVTSGFRWRQEGSGHHATGLLSLDNQDAQGRPLVTAGTQNILLELRDVGKPGAFTLRFENKGWKLP